MDSLSRDVAERILRNQMVIMDALFLLVGGAKIDGETLKSAMSKTRELLAFLQIAESEERMARR